MTLYQKIPELYSKIEWTVPKQKWYWPYFLVNSLFIHLGLMYYAVPEPIPRLPDALEVEYVTEDYDEGINDGWGQDAVSTSAKSTPVLEYNWPDKTHPYDYVLRRHPTPVHLQPAPDSEEPSFLSSLYPPEKRTNVSDLDLELFGKNARKSPDLCSLYKHKKYGPEVLYIFLDSSASMDKLFYTAPATTCAYRAALSAWEQGGRVAVINFSTVSLVTRETLDQEKVARALAVWQGNSTYLPTNLEQIIAPGGRTDIVIVSDGYIDDYEKTLPAFEEILARYPGNKAFFIPIGNENQGGYPVRPTVLANFAQAGFKVIFPFPKQQDSR